MLSVNKKKFALSSKLMICFAAVIKTPDVSDYVPQDSIPLTIICDNVREPGNLGAILRTAAGVGVEKILLTKGKMQFLFCDNIFSRGAQVHIICVTS